MAEFDRNLAVIIGINDYQEQLGIKKLKAARPDAEKLAEILREQGYEVDLLVDEQATFDGITNFLKITLPEKIKTDRRVRLLFYFAGHGTTPQDEEGEAGYLIPQDAEPSNRDKFLSMRWVHDALTKLSCHHLLIILDCCFAGAFRFTTRHFGIIPEEISKQRYDRYIKHRAWQVITSAAHDQKAVDILWDNRGISEDSIHSPFADALFKALENQAADYTKDGITTATELYLYLNDVLLKQNPDKPQVPRFWPLKEHDKGEFIFLTGEFDQDKLPEAPALNENNNPYRGLESFDEAHSKFFFGREELVTELKQHIYLPEHSFTVVLGVSGSGKSSLVKAGLIPKLREDNETKWRILEPIRPTAAPFNALSRTMLSLVKDSEESEWQLLEQLDELLKQVRKRLPQDQDLGKLLSTWRRSSPIDKLWLIIHRFEQLNKWFDREVDLRSLQTLRQIGLNRSQLVLEHFETLRASLLSESERQQVEAFYQSCVDLLQTWSQNWKSDRQQFSSFVRDWCQSNSSWRLLLVVDQFEELVTQCDKDVREAFLDLLSDVLKDCPEQLRVVATLRADFEPRFIDSAQLKPYWDKARFLMRAMRSDELRRAIEGPALEHILYFETERDRNLVDQLIDEVGQMPGALPLLSFALSEIYREYVRQDDVQDRTLKWQHYRKVGGVAGSLTRRANEVYRQIGEAENLGAAAQQTMRRVMLRMLTLEGGETTRQRVTESELVYPTPDENERVKQVVNSLVDARLLVKGQLETGEPYVEPAHDFLVRGWGVLQDWIDEQKAKETLELQQRLTAQTNDWYRNNYPDGLLLPDGERLNRLQQILESAEHCLNRHEIKFVNKSILQAKKIKIEPELLQKAERVKNLISTQPLDALILAIQAMGENLEIIPEKILTPIQSSLKAAMEKARVSIRFEDQGNINSVGFSPDGQMIVSGGEDKTVRLWNLQGNQIGEAFIGHEDTVNSVAFCPDPDSRIIASGGDTTLRLWGVDGKPIIEPIRHEADVTFVAFSQDGNKIASRTNDGKVFLWKIDGTFIRQLFHATSFAFSPCGNKIVSADGRVVRLWGLNGEAIGEPLSHDSDVFSVLFNPESTSILLLARNNNLYVYEIPDFETYSWSNPLCLGVGELQAVSPDGTKFVCKNFDELIIYKLKNGKFIESERSYVHQGEITAVAFSSKGTKIVCATKKKYNQFLMGYEKSCFIELWDIQDDLVTRPSDFKGSKGIVYSIAFNPSGSLIVSPGRDYKICLWNLHGELIKEFNEHNQSLDSVAFSHDGTKIISAGLNEVQIWDLNGICLNSFSIEQEEGNIIILISNNSTLIISAKHRSQDYYPETICLWDLDGNQIGYPFIKIEGYITSIAISPCGTKLVAGNREKRIHLCNLNGESLVEPFYCRDSVRSVAFSNDGKFIISFDYSKTICLWDLNGKVIKQFTNNEDYNEALQTPIDPITSPDDKLVLGRNTNSSLRLWDVLGNWLGEFQTSSPDDVIHSFSFSPNGQLIVAGSFNNIYLWSGHWQRWLQVCCDRLRYHPVFTDPESIEDLEQRKIAIAACETCRKYVWNHQEDKKVTSPKLA